MNEKKAAYFIINLLNNISNLQPITHTYSMIKNFSVFFFTLNKHNKYTFPMMMYQRITILV